MSEENVEIVRAAYSAFNRRSSDDLVALVDPAFVADMSRSVGPERGIYEGHAGFRDLLETYWDAFAEFRIEPTELIDQGTQVVAVTHGHGVGRASGATAEARAAHVWILADGLVRRWTAFQSRAEALEAAGLSK